MFLWTEKYKPQKSSEIQGHNKVIEKLKNYIINFKSGAVLIYGPPGCGKTSSVTSLAKELGYELLEINSSDVRNKDNIQRVVGNSACQMSLFGKGKIILVDEIDGLSGTKDRGGVQVLTKIIESSKWPIILTANDPWQSKLSTLRKKCSLIQFKTLNYLSVFKILKKICKKEKVEFDELLLKSLSRRAGGDLRGAINDLQTLTILGKELVEYDESLDYRKKKEKIFNALKLIFKSKTPENVIGAFDNVDEDLRSAKMWIDENLPYEYPANELYKAYNILSRADVFDGRIRRRQYWRFLVYINFLITVGIALSKEERSRKFVNYKRNTRILKMWQAKMKYGKKRSIAEKVAEKTHISKQRAMQSFLPYLKIIFKNGAGKDLAEDLELNNEEIMFLSA